jgi:2',3'-cyclic-nucleotide 2'-phosphodiesterase (5'-nucleotidase family)
LSELELKGGASKDLVLLVLILSPLCMHARAMAAAQIAIYGLVTPDTPLIARPGPNLVFSDPVAGIRACIAEANSVNRGIDMHLVLSHLGEQVGLESKALSVCFLPGSCPPALPSPFTSMPQPHALISSGYPRDIELAQAVPEIDLIIGGHSHSFLYSGAAPILDTTRNSE